MLALFRRGTVRYLWRLRPVLTLAMLLRCLVAGLLNGDVHIEGSTHTRVEVQAPSCSPSASCNYRHDWLLPRVWSILAVVKLTRLPRVT